MVLIEDYEPSPVRLVAHHVHQIMTSGTTDRIVWTGTPIVLLTTLGAKTGKIRKTPLMRVECHGQYAIVGSLGGAPRNPLWYYNIHANPRVTLQDGSVIAEYDAREVCGDEKALWWWRAIAAFPDYADYQRKTSRQIPVFVLTPVAWTAADSQALT